MSDYQIGLSKLKSPYIHAMYDQANTRKIGKVAKKIIYITKVNSKIYEPLTYKKTISDPIYTW